MHGSPVKSFPNSIGGKWDPWYEISVRAQPNARRSQRNATTKPSTSTTTIATINRARLQLTQDTKDAKPSSLAHTHLTSPKQARAPRRQLRLTALISIGVVDDHGQRSGHRRRDQACAARGRTGCRARHRHGEPVDVRGPGRLPRLLLPRHQQRAPHRPQGQAHQDL